MASVIDAFLVSFGLDPRGYVKGANEVKKADADLRAKVREADREQQRREKEAEERQKKTIEGYRKIRNEVIGLFAVFTAGRGLKSFIADTVNEAASLGYLSQNLKMTAQDLTAWQHASERAGGSAGGITAQLKESADTLAQLKSGLGPTGGLQWFFRMGGSSGDLKDGNTYLLARSKIIHDLFKQDPAQAALIARNLGITEDQFDFIKQGPAAIMALVDAQRKNSAVTEKDAAAALDLRNKYLDLTQSLQATAVKVLIALLPAFSKFIVMIDGITSKLTDNKEVVAQWAENFVNFDWAGLLKDAKDFAGTVRDLTKDIRDLIDRWDEWTGRSKVKTPGVTKYPGAIRIGKHADLEADNAATGKAPSKSTGRPQNETLAKISDAIEEGLARTLASFGVKSAGEYIRDKTGKDDYLVGPKVDTKSTQSKLQAMGWTKEQAAGIAGSFAQESNLNPGAVNPKSGAYGIGQWLGPRRADFKAWAGKDIKGSSLDEQLAFFQFEVTRGKEQAAGDKLRAARTAADAARIHSEAYERPGAEEANIGRRQAIANQMMVAQAVARSPAAGGRNSTTTVTNNIEKVEINTRATDAAGIARDIRPELGKLTFPNQASSGVRQ